MPITCGNNEYGNGDLRQFGIDCWVDEEEIGGIGEL